jgi:Tol biopolymer transport system component
VGAPALLQGLELAPDGKRAAVVHSDGASGRSIWIYEFARGMKSRFSSGNSLYTGMAWSPDGKRLAISTTRDGSFVVFAKDLAGTGGEELILQSNSEVNVTQWLANDDLVVMMRDPKTGWDIAYLPPGEKGAPRKPVSVFHSEANEVGGIVSADGRSIAYASDESGGASEMFVASFPAGTHRRQVAPIGSDTFRWNPNGREILFGSRGKVMAVRVRLVRDEFVVEAPHVLFDLRTDCTRFEVPCFDVSPDGSRLLISDTVGPEPPVALFQNWTASLRK